MQIAQNNIEQHLLKSSVLRRNSSVAGWLCLLFATLEYHAFAATATPPVVATAPSTEPKPAAAAVQTVGSIYIKEYRVLGARHLPPADVEKAVYPFLGPGRAPEDVEQARAALESAYKEKGFQTVGVQIPQQAFPPRGGVVILEVVENKVGRLRVKGSRYYLPSDIKKRAPSIAEGRLPNWTDVTRDIVALNRIADLRVTPDLRAGVEPGTVDIDLNVKDTFPMHGSIELNNRYSAGTVPLRLNGSISYNNLWQLGHSIGASFQVAPERPADAKVFSGYYTMRFPNLNDFSLTLQGTKQDSDVSTLGGAAVAGRGQILGLRAARTLPGSDGFFHSISLGFDYKHFDEDVRLFAAPTAGSPTPTSTVTSTPIDYYPFSVNYGAGWSGKNHFTELNGGMNFHFRGLGSETDKFDNKRFNADGSYIYFRGDLTHTQDLPWGFQAYGKVQGQISDSPLINSEQISGGGLSTVRGYLESAALGDNGIFGSIELRTPSVFGNNSNKDKLKDNEWRFYAFLDAGRLELNDPLPEQKSRVDLASYGFGSRIRLLNHLNASVDAAMPLNTLGNLSSGDYLITFRVWADF